MGVKCEHCGYERPKETKEVGPKCPICGSPYPASTLGMAQSGGSLEKLGRDIDDWFRIAINFAVLLIQGWLMVRAVMIFSDTWVGSLIFVVLAVIAGGLKYDGLRR